jgi:preprotein translocase subunit SecE
MASNTIITKLTRLPQATMAYFKESYAELRKVSWPSRVTTIRYTVVVAISCLVVGAVTGGIDFLLTLALEKIIL